MTDQRLSVSATSCTRIKDKAVPVNTVIQSITFDTIRRAGQFCEPTIRANCVAVTYPEDIDLVPDTVTATLQRGRHRHLFVRAPRPRLYFLMFYTAAFLRPPNILDSG